MARISESELSRRTNIKQPIIHRLLNGENINPKLLTLKPLASYFRISLSQLIGEKDIEDLWEGLTSRDHVGWSEVPLNNWLPANNTNGKKVPKFIVTESVVSKKAFAFQIFDSSMEPLFPEECIVIVEPEIHPEHNDYILIKLKEQIVLRQFLIISDKKYINPINRKFGSIAQLKIKDKILGTVIRTIYDHKLIK